MNILFFGFGYTARVFAARLKRRGFSISATGRSQESLTEIEAAGVQALTFADLRDRDLDGIDHGVVSAPPGNHGDPVLDRYREVLAARARQFRWFAYLSTTGVYGDRQGGWVDEDSALDPTTERGARRLAAERQWLDLHQSHGLPLHIFRLAGIYGPGRNALQSAMDGTARRIVKPGQVFSRIHVDDIAAVLEASLDRPNPGAAYNVCDDEPCPPQDVIEHAARLLGRPPPPEVPFEEAQLSALAASFYADSKRVSNARIKSELGVTLRYPTYREGLAALAEEFDAVLAREAGEEGTRCEATGR